MQACRHQHAGDRARLHHRGRGGRRHADRGTEARPRGSARVGASPGDRLPYTPRMLIALVQMLTEAQVRAALRHDALNVTLAVLFIAVGLAAVSVFRLRRHARSPELWWFGLF